MLNRAKYRPVRFNVFIDFVCEMFPDGITSFNAVS